MPCSTLKSSLWRASLPTRAAEAQWADPVMRQDEEAGEPRQERGGVEADEPWFGAEADKQGLRTTDIKILLYMFGND